MDVPPLVDAAGSQIQIAHLRVEYTAELAATRHKNRKSTVEHPLSIVEGRTPKRRTFSRKRSLTLPRDLTNPLLPIVSTFACSISPTVQPRIWARIHRRSKNARTDPSRRHCHTASNCATPNGANSAAVLRVAKIENLQPDTFRQKFEEENSNTAHLFGIAVLPFHKISYTVSLREHRHFQTIFLPQRSRTYGPRFIGGAKRT